MTFSERPVRRTRWPVSEQVGDDDAIDVPPHDRDLIDADHAWSRWPDTPKLFTHVDLIDIFYRIPAKPHQPSDVFDGHHPALPSNRQDEPLGIVRVRRQKAEAFLFHAAHLAIHAAPFKVQE